MPLVVGSRVGLYEVLAPIGAGGMGEVYRARDTRLNRDVALKVLPDVFSGDADRRARFEREAQLLATLNHPHIAQIYGLEDSAAGIHALVMELVDGPTLADRIAQGPIPVDEALAIARQIAEALEAAHDRGVIHRDLKPANIKLTSDGAVKVLDFGLAKLIDPATASGTTGAAGQSPLTLSPTLSVQATYAGVLLGTAAYMSPEQARGRTVDHRADVWAFGCVVYEMLTAVRPFAGDDLAETIGAVIHKQVDWSRLPANTPAAVRMTLERCLEKDPKRRMRDIGDARLALSGAFETPAAPVVPVHERKSPFATLAIGAGALVLGAAAAGAAVWALTRPAAPQVSRFTIAPAAGQGVAETNTDRQLAISADGRRIVYVSGGGGLGGSLVVRQIDRLDAAPLSGADQARNPFFSPDGQSIGFFTGPNGELRKVPVSGGPSIPVSGISGAARGASWSDDGTIIFATNDIATGLLAVPSSGGEPKALTKPDATKGQVDHLFPAVLPGGKGVLFTIAGGGRTELFQVAVLELATGREKILIRGATAAEYVETGHLVYAAAGTLRAVRFDLEKLEAVGETVSIADRLPIANAGAAQYAISRNGSLVYLTGTLVGGGGVARDFVWVDRRGGGQTRIPAAPAAYTYPRLSPDDTRIAFNVLDQELDIWVWDLRLGRPQRITDHPAVDLSPIWTLDGSSLIFASPRNGPPNLFRRRADGTGVDERLTTSTSVQWPTDLTPDGKTVIVHEQGAATRIDVKSFSLDGAPDGKGQTRPLIHSNFDDEGGRFSPDGRFIAYYSDRSGRYEVYVQPYPSLDGLWLVSTAGGTRPVWSREGSELFYLDLTTAMMAVPVQTKPTFTFGRATKLFDGPWFAAQVGAYDVTKDGRRFLMLRESKSAPGSAAPPTSINVVLNWTEELKQRLPR